MEKKHNAKRQHPQAPHIFAPFCDWRELISKRFCYPKAKSGTQNHVVSGTVGTASQIWCRSAVGGTYGVSGALPTEQVSPGHLHLDGSNLSLVQNKKTILTDGTKSADC